MRSDERAVRVHGIVTAAGGTIRVCSDPGSGTTFHIHLPVAPAIAAMTEYRPEDVPRGTERVLLVDDESMIVAMTRESLESLGYRVTATTSAEEALALFLADPGQFDLLLTDLTMPKLNGEEVARTVLQAWPEMPVLICTGSSETLTAERVRALGVRGVLMKPLARARLARAIREALAGAQVTIAADGVAGTAPASSSAGRSSRPRAPVGQVRSQSPQPTHRFRSGTTASSAMESALN